MQKPQPSVRWWGADSCYCLCWMFSREKQSLFIYLAFRAVINAILRLHNIVTEMRERNEVARDKRNKMLYETKQKCLNYRIQGHLHNNSAHCDMLRLLLIHFFLTFLLWNSMSLQQKNSWFIHPPLGLKCNFRSLLWGYLKWVDDHCVFVCIHEHACYSREKNNETGLLPGFTSPLDSYFCLL